MWCSRLSKSKIQLWAFQLKFPNGKLWLLNLNGTYCITPTMDKHLIQPHYNKTHTSWPPAAEILQGWITYIQTWIKNYPVPLWLSPSWFSGTRSDCTWMRGWSLGEYALLCLYADWIWPWTWGHAVIATRDSKSSHAKQPPCFMDCLSLNVPWFTKSRCIGHLFR